MSAGPSDRAGAGEAGWLGRLLTALAARRLRVAAVAVVIVVLAGLALVRMPMQLLPEVRYPQVRIIGDLPGQTSAVIEESLNQPLEAVMMGLPGLVRMESRSGDGRAYVELFFAPGHDLDRALRDVTQAAQRARSQIPPEFPEPRIFAVSTMQEPALQFAFGSDVLPAGEIRQRLRSHLLPRLRAVPGVEAVYLGREEIPELVVDVDPRRQRALGVDLVSIEQALLEATEPPLGSALRSSWFEGIGVLGHTDWSEERLLAVPLDTIVPGAASLTLGDLAAIYKAPSEERLRTRLDGGEAVLLTVHRSSRAHSLRLAAEVREIVAELEQGRRLEGVRATLLFDDSVVTSGAVKSVLVAAAGGALLAMALLFFALRQRRYMALVGVVVAVSLSAALVTLQLMGMSLNLLTMTGLLLSVGLGLDYAIIYFDRLQRCRGEPGTAHVRAMVEVAGPLLGALLTTIAAVLPFLLVEGMVAMLFRPLIWTVVVSAVFSFVFAMLLLPVFARGEGDEATAADPGPVISERPPRLWWRVAQRPAVVWTAAVLMAAGLWWSGRSLPFEVLPVVDDGFVSLRMTHPAGITAGDLDDLTRQVEQALAGIEGSEAVFATVGGYFREGLPSFRPGTSNFMVRVDTDGGDRPSAEWARDAREVVAAIGNPGLSLAVNLPRIRGVQTRLADADLIVVLTREDGDLLALGEVENQVADLLRGVDGLTDIERLRGGVSPRLRLEPREEAVTSLGVTMAAMRRSVAYALEGRVLRQRMASGEPLALRVRYDRNHAGGPQHLDQLHLPGVSGPVHLGEVMDMVLVEEPTHIERRENQRVIRVAAQLDPSGPGPGRVAREVQRTLAEADLPEGVGWWLEGEVDALEQTRDTFVAAMGLALLVVLTLLVVQYGSLSLAAAAMIAIPLCGLGAMLMLGLMGRAIDAMVLAGLLIAIGIVANNVILVLSQAVRTSAAGTDEPGADRQARLGEALRQAARDRFRPILLTVFSTVLGMSPLLWGGAEIFGLLQPLAIALTGALLLSIPLACVLLPGLASSLSLHGRRNHRAVELDG